MNPQFSGYHRSVTKLEEAFRSFIALVHLMQSETLQLRDIIEFMVRHEPWLLELSVEDAFNSLNEVLEWYAVEVATNTDLMRRIDFGLHTLGPPQLDPVLPPEHWRLST